VAFGRVIEASRGQGEIRGHRSHIEIPRPLEDRQRGSVCRMVVEKEGRGTDLRTLTEKEGGDQTDRRGEGICRGLGRGVAVAGHRDDHRA